MTKDQRRVLGGAYGAAVRGHGADSPEAEHLRRQLAAARIGGAITEALAASGAPLLREDAEALAARLKAASR